MENIQANPSFRRSPNIGPGWPIVGLSIGLFALSQYGGGVTEARTQPAAIEEFVISGEHNASLLEPERAEHRITIPWLPEAVRLHEDEIIKASGRYGVDPKFVAVIMSVESDGRIDAISRGAGAEGLMQVWPKTRDFIKNKRGIRAEVDMFDPAQNIDFGTYYIRYLMDRFGVGYDMSADAVRVIAAGYNGGPGCAISLLTVGLDYTRAPMPDEARRYSQLVATVWGERHLPASHTFANRNSFRYISAPERRCVQ